MWCGSGVRGFGGKLGGVGVWFWISREGFEEREGRGRLRKRVYSYSDFTLEPLVVLLLFNSAHLELSNMLDSLFFFFLMK